jgi:hypothetical protein
MRKGRFTEEQIIKVPKEHAAGMSRERSVGRMTLFTTLAILENVSERVRELFGKHIRYLI